MKIVTLNTWGGKIHKPLLEFFKNHKDVDVFCLQEIYHNASSEKMEKEYWEDSFNLFTDIQNILPHHKGYFRPHVEDCYGLAIFVKQNIQVETEGDIFIYDVSGYQGGGNHSRNLQYLEVKNGDKTLTIANVHGLWNGKGKTDTEERLEQSMKIKQFLDTVEKDKILCGDFNLLPDTESIKIIESAGMRNLIKDYEITSTRTSLYNKHENPVKFADYMFVSDGVSITNFEVLPDEISDHSPLLLEIKSD